MKHGSKKLYIALCFLSIFSRIHSQILTIPNIYNYTDYISTLVVAKNAANVFEEGKFEIIDVIFGKNKITNTQFKLKKGEKVFIKVACEDKKVIFQIPQKRLSEDICLAIAVSENNIYVSYSILQELFTSKNIKPKYHPYLSQKSKIESNTNKKKANKSYSDSDYIDIMS